MYVFKNILIRKGARKVSDISEEVRMLLDRGKIESVNLFILSYLKSFADLTNQNILGWHMINKLITYHE